MAASGSEWSSLVKRKGQIHPTGWIRVFDPADGTARNIGTGHGRGAIAVAPDAVWVANGGDKTVTRLDRNLEATAIAKVRGIPVAIAARPHATWVLCGNGWLWRVSPGAEQTEGIARLGARARAIAATDAWVWVLRESGELIRLDPATGAVTLETSIGRGARQLIEADGTLWATRARGRRLLRIDGGSGEILGEARAPGQITCLTVGHGSLWIGCRRFSSAKTGWLYRTDVDRFAWGEPQVLNGRPRAIATGAGAVWVACAARGEREGTLERVDPAAGGPETAAETAWPVYDLAVVDDLLVATMGLRLATPFDGGAAAHFGIGGEGGGGGDGGGGGY